MGQVSVIVALIVGCVVDISASGIGSIFADENPIRQVVSDGLRELETVVLQVIGQTPHALTFARFAHRYGRKYQSSEEMKHRYSIFAESLETIRSHNKKGLSYTLGVNGESFLLVSISCFY
ncbi:thiol protease aleurain [Helianthus annuus]|uniref:thiol protease aleurain n=1 Tax=Helianthus annuus TaxID=4232 RepID=UPI001652F840|nr:thiol protease aleurain [Helianthus annuus]